MQSKLLLSITVLMILLSDYTFGEVNTIAIDANKEIGMVNKKVFGNNYIGYGYRNENMNYGAGVWDAKWKKPVIVVKELAKEAGISIVRFPGGCGTHSYDWKKTVGKRKDQFLFGIDEFMQSIKEIEAEAVITVSYYTGNDQDASDLVEYLNVPAGNNNINGGVDWANKRNENGHYAPYNVKYFEIGNEVSHGDHKDIKRTSPEEYGQRYLEYYKSMKEVDPSIKIGAVLHTSDWNNRVLRIIRDKIDFGIIHTYARPERAKEAMHMAPEEMFLFGLAIPEVEDEPAFQHVLSLSRTYSGRDIPLAITEYNGGFNENKPVPYRHSLGTALINAEFLRIFMKPEHRILIANYWHFSNSYWGMIKSDGNYMEPRMFRKHEYIKRPNYYVYEFYNKYFGDILLDVKVTSDAYSIDNYSDYVEHRSLMAIHGTNFEKNILAGKWKIKDFPGVHAEETNGILKIVFLDPATFNYYHSFERVQVQPDTYYRLSGYIKTERLVDEIGVSLAVMDARGWEQTKSGVITERVTGESDWRYVEIMYKTLPHAEAVDVIARRSGLKGPIKGQAFFKDVKLEKYEPYLKTNIPYLSVNVSKSADGESIYLMVINKNMNNAASTSIELKNFLPSAKAHAWVMNGPSIESTNEEIPANVAVSHKEFDIQSNPFIYKFEPHSLTAIEIRK